jgi:hypothetical protein
MKPDPTSIDEFPAAKTGRTQTVSSIGGGFGVSTISTDEHMRLPGWAALHSWFIPMIPSGPTAGSLEMPTST